jgi:hypothetical protein
MMRMVLILFGALIAVALLRTAIGVFSRGFGGFFNPPAAKDPNTIEMVKCPGCGSVFAPHNHVRKG